MILFCKHRKLIVAAKMKNLNIALTAGFKYNKNDANCVDENKNSPLFYAALNGDDNFCIYLLELGANIN